MKKLIYLELNAVIMKNRTKHGEFWPTITMVQINSFVHDFGLILNKKTNTKKLSLLTQLFLCERTHNLPSTCIVHESIFMVRQHTTH